MSIVLAIEENGVVYMAADSITVAADTTINTASHKIFWNNGYLIGATGPAFFQHVVKFADLPEFPDFLRKNYEAEILPEKSASGNSANEILPVEIRWPLSESERLNEIDRFMFTEFIPALRSAAEPYTAELHGEGNDWVLLIGIDDQIMYIEKTYGFDRFNKYGAAGIAEQAGLIGLDIVSIVEAEPYEKLCRVLESIVRHNNQTARPFVGGRTDDIGSLYKMAYGLTVPV